MMPNLEYLWDMAVHWVKVVFVIVPVSAWYSFFGFVALLKTVDKQEAFSRAFAEFKGKVAYAKEDDQRFVYENYVQSNMYQEGFGSDQETWFYTFLYCASVCSRHHWFDDQWLSLRVVSVCRANDVAIGFIINPAAGIVIFMVRNTIAIAVAAAFINIRNAITICVRIRIGGESDVRAVGGANCILTYRPIMVGGIRSQTRDRFADRCV